jgi:hypothetical protein
MTQFGALGSAPRSSRKTDRQIIAARVAGVVGPEEPALLEFIARPVEALRPGMIAATAVAAG